MVKLTVSYLMTILFSTIVLLILLSGCYLSIKESDKKYDAQIANSNAVVAKEENVTTRLYIDKMAELATPNYTPLYIFGGLGIVGFIIYYSVNVYKEVQIIKVQALLGNNQFNNSYNKPIKIIPQRIQDKADEHNGYAEYTEGIWYVYDDYDELVSTFTPKNRQIADNNRH